MKCRTCLKEDTIEDEIHVFEQCCSFEEEILSSNNVKFEHIFGTISQQINAISHFMPIINKRNILLDLQEPI